jgi:ADP-L-glycero-D-manno-heptose 6-epimerase
VNDLTQGKILVTGGAGFIGSALIWRLNQLGARNILVADILGTDEKWKNLVPLQFDDFISAEQLLEKLSMLSDTGIKLCLHLGACSATTEQDASYLMENNYQYTQTLCEWALNAGIRFVYASSAATYGDGSAGMLDGDTDLHQLRPLNGYAYSKHLFDLYAKHRGYLSKIVGLKYFNVFGPNESHKGEMRSLVNKAYSQVQDQGRIQLFKSYKPEFRDGEQKRDFLYVKDAVNMTLHLAQHPAANGLYNLGAGKARTWVELAAAVFTGLGKTPKVEFIEMPESIRDKYQYFTEANIDRLKATGYKGPSYTLETAVEDYIQNYLIPDRRLEPGSLRELS